MGRREILLDSPQHDTGTPFIDHQKMRGNVDLDKTWTQIIAIEEILLNILPAFLPFLPAQEFYNIALAEHKQKIIYITHGWRHMIYNSLKYLHEGNYKFRQKN